MKWNLIPQTLPPRDPQAAMRGRWSPRVWLALPDGRVVIGQCLHWDEARRPESEKDPVHSWFIEPTEKGQRSEQYLEQPVAWTEIQVPEHPSAAWTRHKR